MSTSSVRPFLRFLRTSLDHRLTSGHPKRSARPCGSVPSDPDAIDGGPVTRRSTTRRRRGTPCFRVQKTDRFSRALPLFFRFRKICHASRNKCIATRNKCIATMSKGLTSSNKKPLETRSSASSSSFSRTRRNETKGWWGPPTKLTCPLGTSASRCVGNERATGWREETFESIHEMREPRINDCHTSNKCIATSSKCHASSNKCLTSSNKCIATSNKCIKKLLVTSATLVVTSALLVVTRSY